MKSCTGEFDFVKMPEALKVQISSIAESIYGMASTDENIKADASWNWMEPESGNMEKSNSSDDGPDYDNGQWVLIDMIDHGTTVTTDIPHLVKTKWGQLEPWNSYVPRDLGYPGHPHSAVGCMVVAASQYAYFLHYKNGVPKAAPMSGKYDTSSNRYSFPIVTAKAWDYMGLNKNSLNADYAAVYLGYVASKIVPPENFHRAGTGVTVERALSIYLKPETGMEFINDGLSKIGIGIVKDEIKSGYPVIAAGFDSNGRNAVGHAFLIDSYRTETRTIEYVYGWDGLTMSGKDPNIRNLDGTIIKYGITKTVPETSTREYFRMNWGAEGDYDDVLCIPDSWKVGSTYYNYRQEVVLRKMQ